jgi:serine/threonine kinase PknH
VSDAAQSSREGARFGPYLLNRLLGSGTTGEVYQAQDTVHERVVALKLLSQPLGIDPAFRERMEREVLIAERLEEPHVIPVNDHGDIDGQLFIDMRLIEGVNLAELLQEHRELPPPRAVSIVRQVASALDAAHAAGIVHCDVKPENILVSNDDFAYLTDFGIADSAVTDQTTPVESLVRRWRYTAPERFAEAEANHQVSQGQKTSGKLYFDVTGDKPTHVVYADGTNVLATWTQPAPNAPGSTGGSGGSAASGRTGATPAPAGNQTGPNGAHVKPAPAGSQGTPLPAGSQGTPLPAGSEPNPAGTPATPVPAAGPEAPAGTPATPAPAAVPGAPANAPATPAPAAPAPAAGPEAPASAPAAPATPAAVPPAAPGAVGTPAGSSANPAPPNSAGTPAS